MQRLITQRHLDASGIAQFTLACGHQVELASEGALAGVREIHCEACARAQIPPGFAPYKCTPVFDAESTPRGLLRAHATKIGVWGKLLLERGELEYFDEISGQTHHLEAPAEWVIPSARPHHVRPLAGCEFRVEFWGPNPRSDPHC